MAPVARIGSATSAVRYRVGDGVPFLHNRSYLTGLQPLGILHLLSRREREPYNGTLLFVRKGMLNNEVKSENQYSLHSAGPLLVAGVAGRPVCAGSSSSTTSSASTWWRSSSTSTDATGSFHCPESIHIREGDARQDPVLGNATLN